MSQLPPGFEIVSTPQQAPQPVRAPGVIRGTPDPYKQNAENRAEEDQSFQRDNEAFNRSDKRFNNIGKLRDDWNKLPEVKSYRVAVGQLAQALDTGDGPQADLALTYAFAKAMDPDSVVREAEQGMVANSQPWFQAAVEATKKQFGMDGAGSYTPEARAQIRQQIINAVAQRRKLYGQQRKFFEELATRNGFDPFEVVGRDDGQPYFDRFAKYDEQQKAKNSLVDQGGQIVWRDENGDPYVDENGRPLPPEGGLAFDKNGREIGLVGGVSDTAPDPNQIEVTRLANLLDKTEGQLGMGDLARQGLTFNLGDEAAGVVGAIGALLTGGNPIDAYNLENKTYDLRLQRARDNAGWMGTTAETLGAFASGGNALNAAPMTVGRATGTGAGLGALYGFGSGEGFAGSTANALLGATVGGTVGGGVQYGANRIQGAVAGRQAQNATVQQRASELADAYVKEGMTPQRAVFDPNSANRVSGVDASMAGGPRLQRGMRQAESEFQGRVEALGSGGTPLAREPQGNLYRDAGERMIKSSGKATGKKYDAAVREAGDTKVPPQESMAVVDEMIGKLSELPNQNKAELAYLQGLKEDLGKNLSVGGLRDLRTTLRQKISKGELTFGQNEARILDIMDAASNDIRNGLQAAGKGKAAKMFEVADKEYADRMQFIQGTLQKIIGKRNSNISADQVAKNLAGMAQGKDSAGFRAFLQKLTPDELADVRASFADALGTNGKDGFSVSHFLTQTSEKKFPESSLKALFGEEGVASIKRLRLIGSELERVTGAMNSRTSKSAIPGDYRTWLFNLVLGTGGAVMQSPKVIAAAIGVAGAKAARDILSARSLLSSDISKWLASAPRTTNPQAINAHVARLSAIASGNSMARMDAKAIEQYLQNVASTMAQSPGRAAAQEENN